MSSRLTPKRWRAVSEKAETRLSLFGCENSDYHAWIINRIWASSEGRFISPLPNSLVLLSSLSFSSHTCGTASFPVVLRSSRLLLNYNNNQGSSTISLKLAYQWWFFFSCRFDYRNNLKKTFSHSLQEKGQKLCEQITHTYSSFYNFESGDTHALNSPRIVVSVSVS